MTPLMNLNNLPFTNIKDMDGDICLFIEHIYTHFFIDIIKY